MTSLKSIARFAVGLGLAGPHAGAADTWNGYETPPYTVEQRMGEVEIRSYAPHVVAEVAVEGSRDGALRRGFQVLAGYIFGKNGGARKIEMTAPVAQQAAKIDMTAPVTQRADGALWRVTFMMPSDWTLDTLPVPENDAIRLYETEPERLAILRFSGLAGSERVQSKGARLKAELDRAGIAYSGPVRSLFYDDPFTLPWRRRNEVAVLLD